MTKTPQEILSEWADPETGGTMPPEVRQAALSVLRSLGDAEAKLQRVRDWLKYAANSEGGIVAEIDAAIEGGRR